METGGGALMWLRDALCQEETRRSTETGESAYGQLSRMAAQTPAGSDRLIFLPSLSGERAPVLDHYARGSFVGLSLSHTKAHLARAVMEGVAYHLRWICEVMERIGFAVDGLNVIGGGCNSPLWVQIIADVTERPLHVVRNNLEAGASGAALTVAVGLGVHAGMDEVDGLIEIERTVRPDPAQRRRYSELYREYREIYQALEPVHRRLYRID
jgi:xylulokinase